MAVMKTKTNHVRHAGIGQYLRGLTIAAPVRRDGGGGDAPQGIPPTRARGGGSFRSILAGFGFCFASGHTASRFFTYLACGFEWA